MANTQMKCSTLYVIRELQIKTTRYHYTHIRMAKLKTWTGPNPDKDVEQQELSLLVGMQNGTATLEES